MSILDPNSDIAAASRRDLNARSALQGMLAHASRYRLRPGESDHWHDAIAKEAYEIADAMERARKP